MKPDLQEHRYEPTVFVQVASSEQLCMLSMHSTMSSQLTPFISNPSSQEHSYEPMVLIHTDSLEHA